MTIKERAVVLRFLAQPVDVNFGGKVHGGTVMKWIDQAAYACAVGWSGRYCVTVWLGGIRFHHPIVVGSLIEVRARLIHTGRTSLHIAVEVCASDLKDQAFSKATDCVVVFVAVNDHGKATAVETWTPQSDAERRDQAYALRMMEIGKRLDEETLEHSGGASEAP